MSSRPWLLGLRWWHAAFGAIVVFTAVWTVADHGGGGRPAPALVVYGLLVVWYVALPAGFFRGEPGFVYLTGALALFGGALVVTPDASFLLFVLIPQCFVVLEARPAWLAVIGLTLASSASQLTHDKVTRGYLTAVVIFGVMTVVMSLLIAGWVTRIAKQSEQRGTLIDELDRTRAELARVSHEAGMATERARLSGEIHDTLAQGFTSILMLLQAAGAALDPDSLPASGDPGAVDPAEVQMARIQAVRTQLALAEATARDGLAEARSLVAALAPVALQSATLTEAVRRVVDDFEVRTGVRGHLEVTGYPVALPAAAEVVLLRATQEALANVGRHAAAREATVTLAYSDGGPHLTVTDDGRGFDPGAAPAQGYGLRGMRARVEQVGGRLRVRSSPGEGTTVELILP